MNKSLILDLLDEMERNARLLESLRSVSRQDFIEDPKQHLFAERCFQIAIQCLLDICMYIASQEGWERPEDNGGAITLMGQRGVLSKAFAEHIIGMANCRNILVHAYLKIDRGIVFDMLTRVEDFPDFARSILEYLDGKR